MMFIFHRNASKTNMLQSKRMITFTWDDDYYDDQYLRMKVHNRMMWSELDDPYFYNPRYSYSYYNNWSNPWSPNTYWNYYYNPYCSPVVYSPKTVIAYNHPRVFNLNTYNGTQLTNSNYTNPKGSSLNNRLQLQ